MNSRDDFNVSWLINEMPEGIPTTNLIDMITYNIRDLIDNNHNVISLNDNLFKFEGDFTIYYWYESNTGEILLGVELSKTVQNLTVRLLGKKYKGMKPYSSDLYSAILKDIGNKSIRIQSDTQLSDEGFNVWGRLLKMGHKISIYNNEIPGQSYAKIETIDDLKKYFKQDDTKFRQYQFILSENKTALTETNMSFNTRRMRELSGLYLGILNKGEYNE